MEEDIKASINFLQHIGLIKEAKAVKDLIKRNKELEEINKNLKKQVEIKTIEVIDKKYIPKSKVREKIKELKEFQDRYEKCNNLKDVAVKQEEINLLNKLLQEGDDK